MDDQKSPSNKVQEKNSNKDQANMKSSPLAVSKINLEVPKSQKDENKSPSQSRLIVSPNAANNTSNKKVFQREKSPSRSPNSVRENLDPQEIDHEERGTEESEIIETRARKNEPKQPNLTKDKNDNEDGTGNKELQVVIEENPIVDQKSNNNAIHEQEEDLSKEAQADDKEEKTPVKAQNKVSQQQQSNASTKTQTKKSPIRTQQQEQAQKSPQRLPQQPQQQQREQSSTATSGRMLNKEPASRRDDVSPGSKSPGDTRTPYTAVDDLTILDTIEEWKNGNNKLSVFKNQFLLSKFPNRNAEGLRDRYRRYLKDMIEQDIESVRKSVAENGTTTVYIHFTTDPDNKHKHYFEKVSTDNPLNRFNRENQDPTKPKNKVKKEARLPYSTVDDEFNEIGTSNRGQDAKKK